MKNEALKTHLEGALELVDFKRVSSMPRTLRYYEWQDVELMIRRVLIAVHRLSVQESSDVKL